MNEEMAGQGTQEIAVGLVLVVISNRWSINGFYHMKSWLRST
jgi:hypothetical protein